MRVGFRTGQLDDPQRPNWDGTGLRPLRWTAWYPTSNNAVEQEHWLGPASDPTHSIGPMAADAPISITLPRYSVVLLSHGTGGRALGLGWLGRRLAQRGFIAIGIDHHGNTLSGPFRAEGFLCWWERARDLSVLLDQIASHGEFANRIDLERVFVAGYSLGGCTAAALLGAITEQSRFEHSATSRDFARGVPEFPDLADHLPALLEHSSIFRDSWARMSNSYRDPRFRAALMLAPGRGSLGFNEASLASIDLPTAIIVGGGDPTRHASQWLHARLRLNKLDLLGPEVGHYVFLPEATGAGRRAAPTHSIDAPNVNRAIIHDRAAETAIEIFNARQMPAR
jgi:predicted dienelactone hydrolase